MTGTDKKKVNPLRKRNGGFIHNGGSRMGGVRTVYGYFVFRNFSFSFYSLSFTMHGAWTMA